MAHDSALDVWTTDELIGKIGSIERPVIVKALGTWIELGVIKEDGPSTFRLLHEAEAKGASKSSHRPQGSSP